MGRCPFYKRVKIEDLEFNPIKKKKKRYFSHDLNLS